MLGPFAIDAYLPAFRSIGASIQATPVAMQQTLTAYLMGFAMMTLVHGALSDSFGRKPVILAGVAVFALASVFAALATSLPTMLVARVLQGMSAGAGMIVGRALVRDLFDDVDAQRLMSLATIFFGIAPAIAPLIGGVLYGVFGWQSVFIFLACIGVALLIAVHCLLPETLPVSSRQAFSFTNLAQGYRAVGLNGRFVLLALASGVPFNGFFIYVLSAPSFLGELLAFAPQQFWLFFVVAISGIMLGAACSGRFAGRMRLPVQIATGFGIMASAIGAGLLLALTAPWPGAFHFVPIGFYCFGWSLVAPAVTVMVLNLFPQRRGMASSLHGFVGSASNTLTAAIVAPLAMHSLTGLALGSAAMFLIGTAAWATVVRQDR
jgi:MFS transporter, DHA1 family, multidrug resistance protein